MNPATGVADRVGAAIVDDLDGLYRLASQLTGDDPAAQDVVQETAARALAAADGFRGEASARTWLLRIARNVVVDAARRSNRVVPTAEVEALWRNDDYHVDTLEWGRCVCGPPPGTELGCPKCRSPSASDQDWTAPVDHTRQPRVPRVRPATVRPGWAARGRGVVMWPRVWEDR